MIMMLGTALFSIQAFTAPLQPASSRNISNGPDDGAGSGDVSQTGTLTPPEADLSIPVDAAAHSMNSRPESKGFLAVPWIPVSYIRQAIKESSLLQQGKKDLRPFRCISYPSSQTIGVTDRTIRNQINSTFLLQALALHISRLTAG